MLWETSISLSGDGHLEYEASPLSGAPVHLFTAAIATCFAKSCHIVLDARSQALCRVDVSARAFKADTPPNRIDRVEISWAMPTLADDLALRVAKDAKRICTVTNSVTCEFEVIAK